MIYKFGDIANNVTEKRSPKPEDSQNYIGLEHLDSGSLYVNRYGIDVELKGDKLVMHKGDVLLGKRNAYLRRAAIAPHDGLFSAHGMILRPKDVIASEFFPFFIASDKFFDDVIRISVGGLSPTVNWKDLKELEFDLPSLAEQKVLAEKLWAAYEVKQSYLKMIAATEEMVKAQFIEIFAPFENKPEFNHTLQYLIDNDFITYHLDGNHGGDYPRADEFVDEGVPYLSANCINNSQIDWDKAKYLSQQRACKLKKGLAKNGDVLFAHNATVGPTAILRSSLPLVVLGTSLTAYRCNGSKILPEYLFGYMRSLFFCNQYLYGMQQTTRNQVPITAQRKFIFIVPPIEKQITYSDFYNQADKSISELRKSVDAIDKVIKSLINENQ